VVLDVSTRRSFLVIGDSVRSFRVDSTLGGLAPLCGVDRDGHVLGVFGFGASGYGSAKEADSLLVLRAPLGTTHRDTLARVRGGFGGIGDRTNRVNGRAQGEWILTALAVVEDQACLLPGGWIALVQQAPYRVTWLTPQGTVASSASLPEPRLSLTKREQAYTRVRVFGRDVLLDVDAFPPWPSMAPPFVSGTIERPAAAAADGVMLIPR
jgi:hypothetical protein